MRLVWGNYVTGGGWVLQAVCSEKQSWLQGCKVQDTNSQRCSEKTHNHTLKRKINLAVFAWCSQALHCLEKDLQLLGKCEVQLCDPCVDIRFFLFYVASNSQNIEFEVRKPPSSDEETLQVFILRHFNQSVAFFLKFFTFHLIFKCLLNP